MTVSRRPDAEVRKHAARLAKRRHVERTDAYDFLANGDEDGRHAAICVRADEPCARVYDSLPYHEAAPSPERQYVGTGIGAIYGLDGSERHVWQLAGWTIVGRRKDEQAHWRFEEPTDPQVMERRAGESVTSRKARA